MDLIKKLATEKWIRRFLKGLTVAGWLVPLVIISAPLLIQLGLEKSFSKKRITGDHR